MPFDVGGSGHLLFNFGTEKFVGYIDWCVGHGAFQFG